MNKTRERLEQVLRDALGDPAWAVRPAALADRLLAAGVTLPEPSAPLKVWPGLEGDGLRKLRSLFTDAYDAEVRAGKRDDAACRAACTAQAAHLWRALVASLPVLPDVAGLAGCVSVAGHYIPRAALAALADPYDGGGKGVGK